MAKLHSCRNALREGWASSAPKPQYIIASEAKQSTSPLAEAWIASSLSLLAMTWRVPSSNLKQFTGWMERSDTHRGQCTQVMGFASLYPSYEEMKNYILATRVAEAPASNVTVIRRTTRNRTSG